MITSQVNISKALQIGGWMSERELAWLASEAQKCKTITEFGSYHGRSTRALADNSPSDCRIWAVDPWNGNYKDEEGRTVADVKSYCLPHFKHNLKDHIDSGKVIPIRNFSYNFNPEVVMDLVFLDGDHRYEMVVKDINKALDIVAMHGIVCGHDYGHSLWPGVKKAVDEMFEHVTFEDTIWIVRF